MATAANLLQAAGQAYENLTLKWNIDALKSALTAFWTASLPTFPDQDQTARPVANWLTIIAALAQVMPASNVEIETLTDAATQVYKACSIASYLQSVGQITVGQGNTLLAAYNASF